jgi:LysR family cyn operon transcriptional activator
MEGRLIEDDFGVGIAFDEVHSAEIESQALLTETLALVVQYNHPLAREHTISLQSR